MREVLGAMAGVWGVAMAFSPSLQIHRMLVTRSSRDVSVGYFLVLIPGFVLWAAYGVSIDNLVLVIPNVVAAMVALLAVGVALRMRVHGHRAVTGQPDSGRGID